MHELPSALDGLPEIARHLRGRRPAVFLDYDGTLTPIVSRPEEAVLGAETRQAVQALADRCPVAVVSGRDRRDVQQLVGLAGLVFAGSHGFDISAPGGREMTFQQGTEYLPALDRAETELVQRLGAMAGVQVERKKFAIAVHYRRAAPKDVPAVEEAVDRVLAEVSGLRRTGGKKIWELRPDIDWDKGKAVRWLLAKLGLDRPETLPVYVGDDETDEDAFRELRGRGLGIVVGEEERPTAASYALANTEEVGAFLRALAGLLEKREE
jgi:trehalose-phosphatase